MDELMDELLMSQIYNKKIKRVKKLLTNSLLSVYNTSLLITKQGNKLMFFQKQSIMYFCCCFKPSHKSQGIGLAYLNIYNYFLVLCKF